MKVKPILLREKWQPSERCYALLKNKGISKEFAGHCMEGFKLHFLDTGVARPSWDRTFLRWVKGDYEQCDKRRMYREKKPTLPKPPKLEAVPIDPPKPLTREERTATADMLAGLIK